MLGVAGVRVRGAAPGCGSPRVAGAGLSAPRRGRFRCPPRLGAARARVGARVAPVARGAMQPLNITPARLSRLLREHNLTREQFIALYGLRPLVSAPELPARAKLAFALAGGLIFALALFGNALVVYVVARSKAMRTVTNVFIGSLALSDLLITFFCIPVTMLQNIWDNWLGGECARPGAPRGRPQPSSLPAPGFPIPLLPPRRPAPRALPRPRSRGEKFLAACGSSRRAAGCGAARESSGPGQRAGVAPRS